VVFQIVGEAEADVGAGLISITSPIARALIGKEEGDAVDVAAPGGARALEIVSVRYV
jgi:transcription elongation factor GreA